MSLRSGAVNLGNRVAGRKRYAFVTGVATTIAIFVIAFVFAFMFPYSEEIVVLFGGAAVGLLVAPLYLNLYFIFMTESKPAFMNSFDDLFKDYGALFVSFLPAIIVYAVLGYAFRYSPTALDISVGTLGLLGTYVGPALAQQRGGSLLRAFSKSVTLIFENLGTTLTLWLALAGYGLLGLITLGIGFIWIIPRMDALVASVYVSLTEGEAKARALV